MKKRMPVLIATSLPLLFPSFTSPLVARADIFEWEYINPADPNQGKRESTMLAPDGAGANAEPGANLSNRNLTMAYLIDADLTGSNWSAANLTNAELSQANLTGANFYTATMTNANFNQANLTGASFEGALTGANLTQAEVRGANFSRNLGIASGITLFQLYSTASYQAHDLTGIGLDYNDLTGANLAGQNLTNASLKGALMKLTNANLSQANLTNASFAEAALTGANFTGAEVRGAHFSGTFTAAQLFSTASYQSHDLTGIHLIFINLAAANLAGQNLTNANFIYTTLTGANLTGSEVRGADFSRYNSLGGITLFQLYSTASYQAHDLTGIRLAGTDLTGANLAGQNLSNAGFARAFLSGANLTGAQVRGADFTRDTYDGIGSGITVAQLYSTANYQAQDLTEIQLDGNDLTGVNVASQNLPNASFDRATLSNSDFSRANLTNGRFVRATLANATFSQANLTNADFSAGFDPIRSYSYVGANLTGANLSQANLANVNFSGFSEPVYDEYGVYIGENIYAGANLTGANLSRADARGANFQYATLTGANTTNLIQSDGHITGLNLAAGETLVAYPGVSIPVRVSGGFAIAATAKFDLTDNAAIIDYTGASPVAVVRETILSGRGGPGLGASWTGTGITSSTAAAANQTAPDSRSIGYAENATLPLGAYTAFHGQPVDSTAVLIAFTRTGDANLDGVVDNDDVTIVGANYAPGSPKARWDLGDFDYNGFVDNDDVTLLGVFYNPTAPPLAVPAGDTTTGMTAVPEPASLTLLACALVASLAVRRAKKRA